MQKSLAEKAEVLRSFDAISTWSLEELETCRKKLAQWQQEQSRLIPEADLQTERAQLEQQFIEVKTFPREAPSLIEEFLEAQANALLLQQSVAKLEDQGAGAGAADRCRASQAGKHCRRARGWSASFGDFQHWDVSGRGYEVCRSGGIGRDCSGSYQRGGWSRHRVVSLAVLSSSGYPS